MAEFNADNLKLTDFMDLRTLQEIQDSFMAVANVRAVIRDADGTILTEPTTPSDILRKRQAIVDGQSAEGPIREGNDFVAPIIVANQRLGTIRMSGEGIDAPAANITEQQLAGLGTTLGLSPEQTHNMATQLNRAQNGRPAAIQFLFLTANSVARLCYQEYQLRQRISELTALYNITMLLAGVRDLPKMLQQTVQIVAEVMQTKASSIRLIDRENDELIIRAVHNLSPEYLNKGPVHLSTAEIDRIALSEKGYEYVQDMAHDPRVQYPQESQREGIVSMLSVGMRYKGRAIGVLRVYTKELTHFSQHRIDLMKAIAAQAAAAIENTRLLSESIESETLERQVRMAAEVQLRMLPQKPPVYQGLDLATAYVPCYELGGDFFDFIPLPSDNLGLAMADVAGKGVPASLIVASVRAFLRAQADNLYYLYEIVRRINLMLYRDTKSSEFVTLFYGVLDLQTRRLTYCNAGHPQPMVLRDGKITELNADNMILGVDPDETYVQNFIDLQVGDTILLYTDGLADAMNFKQETFGRKRIIDAFAKGGATAEAVAQNILWEMRRFVGLTRRVDDVTLMVVRITE